MVPGWLAEGPIVEGRFIEGAMPPGWLAEGPIVEGRFVEGAMVVGRLADGDELGLCMAPPEFPAGLAAGAAALGAGAAFAGASFLSPAALAMLAAPMSAERINAVEPTRRVLRRLAMLIESSFPFQSVGRAASRLRVHYSTLLTFPLTKVTFISLKK
jgi:hypothetical protein